MGDTFLFYDIETTGLNKAYDQILEFAAIRTDSDLNEIGRFNYTIRLRPDVVPSPAAILVNRIASERFSSGCCEYEAMREVHSHLNFPGTISIGYNSIGFDDEFLRFSFHRNLLPPYTHQYANGCRRMDLLPITIIYWLYRRAVLCWPELEGKPSLKLEDIGAANRLFTGQTHNAMSDVEAALRLARKLLRDGKMWRYLDGCFRREVDCQRAGDLPVAFQSSFGPHCLSILVSSEFGARHLFQAPVLSIGPSVPYPKQILWLRLDLPDLRLTQAESVGETAWVVRKRFGEPGILVPPLGRYLEQIGPERRAQMTENLAWLQANPAVFQAIIRHHRHYRYPFIPELDPDACLYQAGFFPRADEALCRMFHAASSLSEKAALIERFASPDARILAARILFRNYPDALPGAMALEAETYLRRICGGDPMLDYTGHPRITPQLSLAQIQELKQAASLAPDQYCLLESLEQYILRQFGSKIESRPDQACAG